MTHSFPTRRSSDLVCRMRSIPVMVFINKLDREGRDPFVLLEELEKELQISVRPLTWPIGMGRDFKGVYQLYKRQLRSEEHTSELQSLMRISYAVFCLKKKQQTNTQSISTHN